MKRYTIIATIKTTIAQAAQEVLDLMGEGARPDAEQIEGYFARNNTPVQGPDSLCRIVVDEHIATALQWMLDQNITGEHIDSLRVEWQGQDMVLDTDTGEAVYAPITWEETLTDEQGNPYTVTKQLGRIGV